MYAELLRRIPYQIDEAEDGYEALAKVIAHEPSVVIMETRLPGLSGLELCRHLRSNPLTAAIPIIFLTGDALEQERRLAESAGADAVLIKPCLPMRLAAELDRVLSSRNSSTRADPPRAGRAQTTPSADAPGAATKPAPEGRVICPECTQSLTYLETHRSPAGERHLEEWDYFVCPACGVSFERRRRTRSLRACLTGVPPYRLPQSNSK